MKKNVRVIPRLDIKGPNLVKGIQLEGLRVLGRPEVFARHYYEQGADELLYMDIVASLYDRASLLQIVEQTSRETHIPLTVGGGLRTVDDIRAVLGAGADKVAINTAAVKRPALIQEAVARFGSSTLVISIEAKLRPDGSYEAYVDGGRERTHLDARQWAHRAVELGAGEIMVTSIDREGTGRGFDLGLLRILADELPVPVIASGGAGNVEDVRRAIEEGHADAVCVAGLLHYDLLARRQRQEDERGRPLASKRPSLRLQPASMPEIKRHLTDHGAACRV